MIRAWEYSSTFQNTLNAWSVKFIPQTLEEFSMPIRHDLKAKMVNKACAIDDVTDSTCSCTAPNRRRHAGWKIHACVGLIINGVVEAELDTWK